MCQCGLWFVWLHLYALSRCPTALPMNLVLEYRDVVTTARYVNVVVDFFCCEGEGGLKAVIRNIPLSR